MKPPINIALAGLGDVSFQHKRALDMCEHAHITGAWTRNTEKLEKLTGEWSIGTYRAYDDILADDDVRVVDITAADEVHYDFALRALEAGKHVIVEKPPAGTAVEVAGMMAAAERAGLQCIPMHNYVYRPRMLQAKRLIEAGKLGTVTFAFFSEVMNMPEEWAVHYDGVLTTAVYHLIYSSLFLLGKPDRIYADSASLHYTGCVDDDLATVQLHYPGGAMAVLLGNWTADDMTANSWFSMYKLMGTGGGINISGQDALVYSASGWGSYQWPDYEDTFIHTLDWIVRNCFVEGGPPLSGLEEAATTMRIIERARLSAREHRAVPL